MYLSRWSWTADTITTLMVIQLDVYYGHVVPGSASSSGMPSLGDELQHLGGSTEMHWLENTVRDLRRRVFGPWGHQQPLMALTSINLDTFLFYFQLFLSALWHPAALFVLQLWQIGLFPTPGIFILWGSLTASTVAPLHANYRARFLWLLFAVPHVSELLCPFSHLCNISAPKNKENFFNVIWNFWSTY